MRGQVVHPHIEHFKITIVVAYISVVETPFTECVQGVGPLALTGVGARLAPRQQTTLQLSKVRHVVAQEEVVRVGRPTIIIEHLKEGPCSMVRA